MAEKAMHPFAFAITLTYGNETQFQRDGAAFFRYSDIRKFLAYLREQIFRQTGERQAVRFVCAGEQGDRKGRCHWHIIIFSHVDLLTIGTFTDLFGVVSDPEQIVTKGGQHFKRLRWSLWPHGLCVVQEPDQGGMSYALAYAIKDQFSHEKSKGTLREATAEVFGTGLFRMSKRPPLGLPYIEQRMDILSQCYSLPPEIKFRIPNLSFPYRPTGPMRRYVLERCRDICQKSLDDLGKLPPQYSALMESLGDNEVERDLLNGKTQSETLGEIAADISRKSRELERDRRVASCARNCGSTVACSDCLNGHTIETLESYGIKTNGINFYLADDPTGESLKTLQSDARGNGINPLCLCKESPICRLTFPKTNPKSAF